MSVTGDPEAAVCVLFMACIFVVGFALYSLWGSCFVLMLWCACLRTISAVGDSSIAELGLNASLTCRSCLCFSRFAFALRFRSAFRLSPLGLALYGLFLIGRLSPLGLYTASVAFCGGRPIGFCGCPCCGDCPSGVSPMNWKDLYFDCGIAGELVSSNQIGSPLWLNVYSLPVAASMCISV